MSVRRCKVDFINFFDLIFFSFFSLSLFDLIAIEITHVSQDFFFVSGATEVGELYYVHVTILLIRDSSRSCEQIYRYTYKDTRGKGRTLGSP